MIKCYFEFARDSRFRAPKVSGVDCSIDPGLQFLNLKSIRYSSNSSHDITREHYVMEKTRYVGRDREIREAISTCLSDFESRLITKHKQHRANICVSFILLPQNYKVKQQRDHEVSSQFLHYFFLTFTMVLHHSCHMARLNCSFQRFISRVTSAQ